METLDKVFLSISGFLLSVVVITLGLFYGTGYTLHLIKNTHGLEGTNSLLDINYLDSDINDPYKIELGVNNNNYVDVNLGSDSIRYEKYSNFNFNLYTAIPIYDNVSASKPEFAKPGFDVLVKGPFYMDLCFEDDIFNNKLDDELNSRKLKNKLNKDIVYLKKLTNDSKDIYSYAIVDSFKLDIYMLKENKTKFNIKFITNDEIVEAIKNNTPLVIKNSDKLPFLLSGRIYVDFSFQEVLFDGNNIESFINRVNYTLYPNKDIKSRGILLPNTGILERQPFQLSYIDEDNDRFIYSKESKLMFDEQMRFLIKTDIETSQTVFKLLKYNIRTDEYDLIKQEPIGLFHSYESEILIDTSELKNGKYRVVLTDFNSDTGVRDFYYDYYMERKAL